MPGHSDDPTVAADIAVECYVALRVENERAVVGRVGGQAAVGVPSPRASVLPALIVTPPKPFAPVSVTVPQPKIVTEASCWRCPG